MRVDVRQKVALQHSLFSWGGSNQSTNVCNYKCKPQLTNQCWMPNSVKKGLGSAMRTGSYSIPLQRYPKTFYRFYIGYPLLWIRIKPYKPQSTLWIPQWREAADLKLTVRVSLKCYWRAVLMAVPKPLLGEIGIHHGLESCAEWLQANLRALIGEKGP